MGGAVGGWRLGAAAAAVVQSRVQQGRHAAVTTPGWVLLSRSCRASKAQAFNNRTCPALLEQQVIDADGFVALLTPIIASEQAALLHSRSSPMLTQRRPSPTCCWAGTRSTGTEGRPMGCPMGVGLRE